MSGFVHTTVMRREAVDLLDVTAGGRYCDGTLGGGGHAREILERCGPDGVLIGLDRDPAALAAARTALAEFGERVLLLQANFGDLLDVLGRHGLIPVDGLLVDLGISSHQVDTAARGFSFSADGPLDMRMNPEGDAPTARQLIARLSTEQLARLLRDFGEERRSLRVARAIKEAEQRGELTGTRALAAVVMRAIGSPRASRIHPATRTFQALRIAVNDELGALERFLDQFVDALRPGGRVAVISFHSLEDRRVKQRFAELANPCICPPDLPLCACGRQAQLRPVTRRAVRPTTEEVAANPRARSARLRAAERI